MRKRKLQSVKGNSRCNPVKTENSRQNNGVETQLTCTFVKTSLENDELEVAFKVRSVIGKTAFKLFQEGVVKFEAVSTSLKSIKKQGLCLGCGELTNLIQKVLTFSVGVDEVQSHCSKCFITSQKKSNIPNNGPESHEEECDISEQNITTLEKDNVNEEISSVRTNQLERGEENESNKEEVHKPKNSETQETVKSPKKSPKFTPRKLRERKGNKVLAIMRELSSDVEDLENENVPTNSVVKPAPSSSNACENKIESQNELFLEKQNTSEKDLTWEITEKNETEGQNISVEKHGSGFTLVKDGPVVNSPRKKSPLKCEVCGKTLLNKKTLASHLKTHTAESSFVCKICNRRFSCIRYLKKHEKTHTKEKPYSCEICGQRFKLKESLPKHMILHKEQKPYQCFICEKQFHLEKQLKMHLPIHTEERKFICELCGKRFRTQGSMKSHMATHEGPQKHSCEQCGKSYRSVWYLKIHQKTHTGQNLIQCPDCKDWFIDPCYFKLHQKKFCKGKTLLCNQCGLEFPHNQALQSHMGLHTGERPFGCNFCGKAFAKSSLLAEHMKRHTLKDCLKCRHCSKSFINKKELLRHEKIHSAKKKKAYLPESLKPRQAEAQGQKQEQESQVIEEEVVMKVDSINNHAQEITVGSVMNLNEYMPVVSIQETDSTVSDNNIKYLQNRNSSYIPRTDSSVVVTDTTGASTQILSSRGGHITVHEPVTISNFFPSSVESQNIHFPGPYSIPHTSSSAVSQSNIVSTPEGEHLQQLQPVSVSTGASVVFETEATVQHLLEAAAIMKDF